MFDLFEKIHEFFKNIMIDIIKDNLSAMLVDINDKVSTVAGEVVKTSEFLELGGLYLHQINQYQCCFAHSSHNSNRNTLYRVNSSCA